MCQAARRTVFATPSEGRRTRPSSRTRAPAAAASADRAVRGRPPTAFRAHRASPQPNTAFGEDFPARGDLRAYLIDAGRAAAGQWVEDHHAADVHGGALVQLLELQEGGVPCAALVGHIGTLAVPGRGVHR